jgi:hypothetical protein
MREDEDNLNRSNINQYNSISLRNNTNSFNFNKMAAKSLIEINNLADRNLDA